MSKLVGPSFLSAALIVGAVEATFAQTAQEKMVEFGWRSTFIAMDPCVSEKSHAIAMAVIGTPDKPVLFFTCSDGHVIKKVTSGTP